jgi:hypothetical protein
MKKLIVMDLVWICGSDLTSRTSDEKHECMGYDSWMLKESNKYVICMQEKISDNGMVIKLLAGEQCQYKLRNLDFSRFKAMIIVSRACQSIVKQNDSTLE